MIVVLTIMDDLHARAVQTHVRAFSTTSCHIVECDRIAQRRAISYGVNYAAPDELMTTDDERIPVSEASVIWLRRMSPEQQLTSAVGQQAEAIIHSDCRGALLGLLATHFHGKWVSAPDATAHAADKLRQLDAAQACGFRVPRTLVSQSRDAVTAFYEACERRMIVKAVVGAPGPFLQAVQIEDVDRLSGASVAAAPAIYQELIPGKRHLRLNCFGDTSYAALIESEDLDWRGNLNVPITSYAVDDALHARVRAVLDMLGLEMGVVDLKLTPEGEPVWLEVNPQGQFLFLDPLTGMRLAERFAEYLVGEASNTTSMWSSVPRGRALATE